METTVNCAVLNDQGKLDGAIKELLSGVQQSLNDASAPLTKGDVAKRFGVKERAITEWMRKGLIPYFKMGKLVYFEWPAIMRHLRAKHRYVGKSKTPESFSDALNAPIGK